MVSLENLVHKRATEKVVGMYMSRIALAVPPSLGERPHVFKLNDPGFFEEEFDTADGPMLKAGVEKVIEKLEILSSVTLKNRKFKVKAEKRLDDIEKAQLDNVKKTVFANDLERTEQRMMGYIRE